MLEYRTLLVHVCIATGEIVLLKTFLVYQVRVQMRKHLVNIQDNLQWNSLIYIYRNAHILRRSPALTSRSRWFSWSVMSNFYTAMSNARNKLNLAPLLYFPSFFTHGERRGGEGRGGEGRGGEGREHGNEAIIHLGMTLRTAARQFSACWQLVSCPHPLLA